MSPAPILLVFLIFIAPVTIIFDGPIVHGFIAAVAALLVAVVAARIGPGEARFLLMVIRPVAVLAAIPAICMLAQVIPLQGVGLAHPIWKSAAAALGQPLAGTISIDPGATLISFVRYVSAAAIAFVAAAVSIDRLRAEWVLFTLTTTTTLTALMALAAKLGIFISLAEGAPSMSATDLAGLGVIFATATILHTYERGKTPRPGRANLDDGSIFTASLAALGICLGAVIVGATGQGYFAISCGVAVLAIAVVIRRFSLGPWGVAAITSTALLVAIAAVALQPGGRITDLTLAFASQAPTSLVMITQRVLSDTSWAGTGAGTFGAVLPIYQDINELATEDIAPTAASAIAVEMGRPFFWALLVATIAVVFALLHGALQRQRNSYYSTAGASCIMAVALLSFGNSASLGTPMSIFAAAAIGMALAQSKSRLI